jgi:hypothetical protein
MKARRSSLYIKTHGVDEAAISAGLAWLLDLARKDSSKRLALLAVPVKSNLRGAVSSVIGETSTRALQQGKKLTISSTVQVSLLTERERIYSWSGPVLAIYPTKRLLDIVDGLIGITDVLVIPWTLDEVQYWIDTWSAIELGPGIEYKPSKLPPSALNPIVEAALESLTNRVNLSTGILHPLDRAAAIELFRILRGAGITYDPGQVRAWLVSRGRWNPRDADDVAEVASGILAGKRLRGGSGSWSDKILEMWRDRAEKLQNDSV